MTGRRVVVIGGAGFIGSHLVDHLVKTGNEVLVLDNLISGRKDFVNPAAKFIWCDITHSESFLSKVFQDVDYVFNYAAEPYVPASYERPLHVFDINARGALMVMNAAHAAGVTRILQVSSAEIYGDVDADSINEEHPARPRSTYGAAKLAIDTMVQTRFRESGCPAIALRQFNCIGERDVLHPYVVPEIYRQAKIGDEIRLGNNSYRDFMYAGDAVRIATELAENGLPGEVYNLGAESGIQIYALAKMIGTAMGRSLKVVTDNSRKRKWEIWRLQSDNTKIYKTVEARPKVDLYEAVDRTIDYYEDNASKWAF